MTASTTTVPKAPRHTDRARHFIVMVSLLVDCSRLTNRASAAGDRPPATQHLHYLTCTHQPPDPRAASARPLQALVRPRDHRRADWPSDWRGPKTSVVTPASCMAPAGRVRTASEPETESCI